MNQNFPAPQFARSRNPDLEYTNLRVNLPLFTFGMLEAEMHGRRRTGEPRCSTNQVINEILDGWAEEQWRQSQIDLRLVPDNPFEILQFQPRAGQLREDQLTEVRASVRKFTLDVVQAHVDSLTERGDIDASRGEVIRQILTSWALKRWHRSSITIERVPVNPFIEASQAGEPSGD